MKEVSYLEEERDLKVYIISSPEPKSHGELLVYQSSRRPSLRPSVCLSTFSNMNISTTREAITMKFYQKHYWGGGKAALGFKLDRTRTLVSMATESSHRVIMGKNGVAIFSRLFFIQSFSCLQVMMTCIRARKSSKFGQIRPPTAELAAPERLKKKSP